MPRGKKPPLSLYVRTRALTNLAIRGNYQIFKLFLCSKLLPKSAKSTSPHQRTLYRGMGFCPYHCSTKFTIDYVPLFNSTLLILNHLLNTKVRIGQHIIHPGYAGYKTEIPSLVYINNFIKDKEVSPPIRVIISYESIDLRKAY